MTLPVGTRLGACEITGTLGAGGMGEVYRARDTRLGRDVAIKILPEAVGADPDRLARFEREARTLAALNHPNIAQVYDAGRTAPAAGAGPVAYIVMELVEGQDLAERLTRGPVPLAEVLPMARQIADALEAAHEQGIIHRDLKPANIKVRDDATVKVLDFGLAKVWSPETGSGAGNVSNSPTLTARATQMGMVLGTAAYMAPEQARGRPVDRRADIWAFGVVVAELLTGVRAFAGEDPTAVIARVIERDPDLSALPAPTPPALRRLLARCLAKDPKQRLRDIGEARIAVDEAAAELARGLSPASAPPALTAGPARSAWARLLPWGLVVVTLGVLAYTGLRPAPPGGGQGTDIRRLQVSLPEGIELYSAVGAAVSISPDGATLAFVGVHAGMRHVYLRRLDDFAVTPVTGTESAVSCVFSPDGRQLLVGRSDTSLARVRLSDGLVELVTPSSSEYLGGWVDNERVVFTKDGRLFVSAANRRSEPMPLTEADAGSTRVESQPVPVPGEDAVVFVSSDPGNAESARVEAVSIATRQRHLVVDRASSPVVTMSGHLLFAREGVVIAAPFDGRTLRVTGDASPVLRDVNIVSNRGISAILTVSATGVLVYSASASVSSEVTAVSRDGQERLLLRTPRLAANPRLSPDGRTLVFEELRGGLWRFDMARRTLERLGDGATFASFPIFARDGRSVVFRSASAMFTQPVDGSARPRQIPGTAASEFPTGFSMDGKELFFTKIEANTAGDVRAIPIAGGESRALISTPAYEGSAQLSPDGRWMVYVSNESGGTEVVLQPYPALNRRYQVSSGIGLHPVWNPRGGEIFYRSGNAILAVRLNTAKADLELTAPTTLFSGRFAFGGGLTIPNYTVTPDGETFILVKEQSGAVLNVVLNWFEELKRAR